MAVLDLYNLTNHSGSGTISKIIVHARVRDLTVGRIAIKTGGTIYYSGNLSAGATYENKSFDWTTNPQTTIAWTWDDIDALQAGIELPGTGGACTQLYVEVDYTAGGSSNLIVNYEGGVASGLEVTQI
jgi:hypothetical protein